MPTSKKKVLVAEDEKPMAKALILKLQKAGFEAQAVYNGEDALKELEANKYDVLLLDLMMPTMDGFAVLEAMKKKGIKTPVIVSSNLGQESDQERAKDLGAADYFIKSDTPITEVISHITSVLY